MQQHDIHILVCRAKDSSAQIANAWRLVQVQQVYNVTMTVPLTLAADNLTDARVQAARITTGNNATLSLADALAAGLIAGESAAACLHDAFAYICACVLPITLAADNLTDARAQAARITTGSNPTLSLASALAAGLTAVKL